MSENDDSVGYRKPPKHSQFKPGQSGNPRGRKPLFYNFESDLFQELDAEISIHHNGVECKVSKQRAIIKTLVDAAISGNMRASSALLAILQRSLSSRPEQDQEPASEAADHDLLKRFDRRQPRVGSSQPAPSKQPRKD
jgi:hypothetical protein